MNRLTPARLSMVMFMVVGGLIAAYIAKGLLAVEEKKTAAPPLRNIPMAISDLPAGTLVTEAHLGLGPVLPSKMTRDVLLSNKSIVGRVTKESITAAEPIHSGQLYEKGVYPPLKVRKGMQAVTILLGSAAIVDGLVKPGQFVDVHFSPTSLASDPRIGGGMTMTLFKGVKIVTINRQSSQGIVPGNDQNSVTLELSSEQANVMLVARDKGTLYFSYNPDGQGTGGLAVTGKDRATLEEILGLQPIPKPPAPPTPFISQIYRGPTRRQYEFRQVGSKMMEWGGGAASVGVPPVQTGQQGSNGPGQQQPGPQDPGSQQPASQQPGAAGYDAGSAPPAPGYDPGVPAPPGPVAPGSTINLQIPQPPAPSEKLF
jgi:pilus assembly protein CpaB